MMEDWAMKRAQQLTANKERSVPRAEAILAGESDFLPSMEAFAAYIREHEQPPVDPDLIEARKIVADDAPAGHKGDILRGGWDDYNVTKSAFAALKRGRELERGE